MQDTINTQQTIKNNPQIQKQATRANQNTQKTTNKPCQTKYTTTTKQNNKTRYQKHDEIPRIQSTKARQPQKQNHPQRTIPNIQHKQHKQTNTQNATYTT